LVSPVGRQQPKGSPRRHAAGYPTEVGNPNRHRLTLSNPNACDWLGLNGVRRPLPGSWRRAAATHWASGTTGVLWLIVLTRIDQTVCLHIRHQVRTQKEPSLTHGLS